MHAEEGAAQPGRQRRDGRGLVRPVQDAARSAARGPRPHRHQARLRARRMRRLRGAGRRGAAALLPVARARVRRAQRRNRRGARQRRGAASAASRVRRPRRRSVRLLHPRPPHDRESPAGTRAESIARADPGSGLGESLPLHRLPADLRSHRRGGEATRGWNMKVIGKPRRRVDGRAKVTGQTRFADDLALPRMLHMRLLRSPHPHALIEQVGTDKAKAHPGVHLVLTGKDFPVSFGILPVTQDEYPLAPEHVRYVGDPVAAVVAKDEQTASEALDLIEVKYKLLKTIADPMDALQNPEPRIHAYSELGNIHRLQAFEFAGRSNEVTEAIDASDHVFEDLFFYEGNTHLPIEQHAAVAEVDGA